MIVKLDLCDYIREPIYMCRKYWALTGYFELAGAT